MANPRILQLPSIRDQHGAIGIIENSDFLPFQVKRVYFLFDLHPGSTRGEHAHKTLHQIIFVPQGECTIKLTDGSEEFSFTLNRATDALYVPPGYWRSLGGFVSGTSVIVLASETYDESDYMRNWGEFIQWAQKH